MHLKKIAIAVVIIAVAAFSAFKLAYWRALSGYFNCIESGCGILAETVLWPLLTMAILFIVATAFFFLRGSNRKKKGL